MMAAFCSAFAFVACSDENDEPTPPKKSPFTTLTQVSLPGIACTMTYNEGDTMIAAKMTRGKDVIDLTFGHDPYSVFEKSVIDMENYTHNYQEVEEKKGKVVKMVSGNGAKTDSVIFTHESSQLVTARIVAWENDTTKRVYDKKYAWNGSNLSKVSILSQVFVGADSVTTPRLDEYTFSYKMAGGPMVHWQFLLPVIMEIDFSWAGYAELFFSEKSNSVPTYCKAEHYPDANNKLNIQRETFSISETDRKTSSVTYVISCQEFGGSYWQKQCKLEY